MTKMRPSDSAVVAYANVMTVFDTPCGANPGTAARTCHRSKVQDVHHEQMCTSRKLSFFALIFP